ncbi:Hypothetical protein EIN_032330, partial [Entamoeba invadens IP1]
MFWLGTNGSPHCFAFSTSTKYINIEFIPFLIAS